MAGDIRLTGVVHGASIQFDQPIGFGDGQRVEVAVRPVVDKSKGEGIRASAGAWADAGPEFDAWLAEVYESRKAVRPVLPE